MDLKDRERVVVEVVQRVLDHCGSEPQQVEQAVFDILFEERRRIETERDKKTAREQGHLYERIHSEALHADPTRHKEQLKRLIQGFADEVVGHFDQRVYALATRAIPPGLSLLLNAMSPIRLIKSVSGGMTDLDDRLEVVGPIDHLQKLARQGTLIMTPTHSSNLDSILMGYSIYRLGLPPHLYGAGLNLFHNKLLGFFMHNLGAYKVDRRKKAAVYKDVLKTYAGCSLELGYHNLFFPGGTRSRSGGVERKLKLGLLGMGLDAYIHNLLKKKSKPDIFVVPCTINYELVLEADTLIDDHLKEAGKSRYIIDDDESTSAKRIADFLKRLFSLDSQIHVSFGHPLDVFGNRVDEEGVSRDFRGRPVDRQRYVVKDDVPVFNQQRDAEYTRELSRSVATAYQENTILKSTNVVAFAIFSWLKSRAKGLDLYRLLRTGGPDESLTMVESYEYVDRALNEVRKLRDAKRLELDPVLLHNDTPSVVNHALAHLGCYHRRAALVRRGDRLFHEDRNLLLFYQNRLNGYRINLSGEAS